MIDIEKIIVPKSLVIQIVKVCDIMCFHDLPNQFMHPFQLVLFQKTGVLVMAGGGHQNQSYSFLCTKVSHAGEHG